MDGFPQIHSIGEDKAILASASSAASSWRISGGSLSGTTRSTILASTVRSEVVTKGSVNGSNAGTSDQVRPVILQSIGTSGRYVYRRRGKAFQLPSQLSNAGHYCDLRSSIESRHFGFGLMRRTQRSLKRDGS